MKVTFREIAVPMVLICGMLTGCSSSKKEEASAQKSAPAPVQNQISTIQNDPNMSPEAKQAALQTIQQREAAGAGMRAAAQKK